jgi:hypothetical protein
MGSNSIAPHSKSFGRFLGFSPIGEKTLLMSDSLMNSQMNKRNKKEGKRRRRKKYQK